MIIPKQGERIVGALYLSASFSLAFFCLFQSHRMSHDQRARDLAGRSIHSGASAPKANSPAILPSAKKIGEEE
jgi:hypothetical protein